ncbi:MAG TPA: alpha-L-fucosidase, partial [Polyangiaceae bacterium]
GSGGNSMSSGGSLANCGGSPTLSGTNTSLGASSAVSVPKGGTFGVGGAVSISGSEATGGSVPTPTGGHAANGSGTSVTGGTSSSGGHSAMGGSSAATSTITGGRAALGGTSTMGGSVTTGGSSIAGGVGAVGGAQSCPAIPGAPAGLQPLPSAAQVAYQRTELTAFIHFSMATYDGTEQGNTSDLPTMFNPTNLDSTTVGQWASSLKSAGFGQSMLVTKHSIGFCLWPSKYTTYSVKSCNWMSGNGDIVQLWSDAMRDAGMRPALYLGPWDQKYTSSKTDYETYFKNQIAELFAYGPAYEIEFDGYNAPTTNVNWKSVFQYLKGLQPNILIWAGPEIVKTGAVPDLQWIGNENGQGTRSTSSVDTKNCGGGSNWCPYECNVSDRRPNWFWHPNQNPMTLSDMQSIYFATVGMNCTLNFNVPPSQTGEFDAKDIALLQQFGAWYSALYTTNLAKGQTAACDSTWASVGFEASKAIDGDICTYWAAASGKKTGRLEVTFATSSPVKLISIREPIELGERSTAYHVELKQNGSWNKAPTDKSGAQIKGTVIGQRQLWQLDSATAEAIALVIDSAKDVPAIAEFSAY